MAAPVYVQSASSSGGPTTTTLSIPFVSPNTAGNAIFVVFTVAGDTGSNAIFPSDSNGNTYSLQNFNGVYPGLTPPGASYQIWLANNIIASANTVTIDLTGIFAGMNQITAYILEYDPNADMLLSDFSAVANNDPVGNDPNLTVTMGPGDLGHFPDLTLVVGGCETHGFTFTPGAGYNLREHIADVPNLQSSFVADKVELTTGGFTATATMSASGPWFMTAACFYQNIPDPSLEVTPATLAFKNRVLHFPNFVGDVRYDQSQTLTLTSDLPWTATVDDPWITLSRFSGNVGATITVSLYMTETTMTEMTNGTNRPLTGGYSTTIRFTDGTNHATVAVTLKQGYGDQIQQLV